MASPPRRRRPLLLAVGVLLLASLAALLVAVRGRRGAGRAAGAPHARPDERARGGAGPRGEIAADAAGARGGAPTSARALALSTATRETDEAAAAGAFEGRVVAVTDGRPVPGASLSFAHQGATRSVVTDAAGAFRFVPDAPGRYDLVVATAEGFLPFAPEFGQSPIALFARPRVRVRDIVLSLTPRVAYAGLVRDAAGAPVPGARVRVIGAGVTGTGDEGPPLVTDARGEFRFTAPDDALLEARARGYAPGRAVVDHAVQVSHRLTITLAPARDDAQPDGVIAGRVLDAQGQPADGAVVDARSDRDELTAAGPLARARAVAAPDGTFQLTELDPSAGPYLLTATAPGLQPAQAASAAVGARDVVLRLAAGGAVRGVVREAATQRPVAGFTVVLFEHRGPLERRTAATATVFDADGRYEVRGLAPGTYDVTVAAHDYAPASVPAVAVGAAGAEPATADFALSRGGRVRGRVTDARTRAPIERARVSVEGTLGGGDSVVPLSASTSTDAQGRFELGGLAPGSRSVLVAAAGHHSRVVGGLTVAPEGGELADLAVELTPTAEGETPRIELAGIGAVLAARGDAMLIGRVIPGGGAAEVGLVAGDAILAVDGESVVGLGFDGTIARIRGPEGSVVRVTVRRANDAGVVEMAVPRRRIQA